MPTIIDSLIVKLGLSSSEFSKGMDQVDRRLQKTGGEAGKTGETLKKSTKEASEGFDSVGKTAAKFLALIGGTYAIKSFIEQTIDSSAVLDRLSKNLGSNVETITTWSNAVQFFGGSAAGMQSTLSKISMAQTEWQQMGTSSMAPLLARLNVSLLDMQNNARPVADVLSDIGQSLMSKTGGNRQTAFNLGTMLGIDPGTLNMILQGRKEIEATLKRQKEYADAMAKFAPIGVRFQRALVDIKQKFFLLGLELLTKAAPAIETALNLFVKFGDWTQQHQPLIEAFLGMMAAGIAAIALKMMPLSLTVLGIVALAAAIALLWDDYQTWKAGGDTLIPWDKWEPGVTAAKTAIKDLADILGDLFYRYAAAVDMSAGIFSGDWGRVKNAAGHLLSGTGKGLLDARDAGAATEDDGMMKAWEKRHSGNTTSASGIMSFFEGKGWSKEASADITANLQAESGFNHTTTGDGGRAYGVAQWHPDRQEEFRKKYGRPIQQSTLNDQLEFVHYELTAGKEKDAGDRLKSAQGIDALGITSRYYERPADIDGETERRRQAALNLLGGIPGAATSAAGVGASASRPDDRKLSIPGVNQIATTIGAVNVYTQATDAEGIAKDMGKSLDYLFTSQANYGLR